MSKKNHSMLFLILFSYLMIKGNCQIFDLKTIDAPLSKQTINNQIKEIQLDISQNQNCSQSTPKKFSNSQRSQNSHESYSQDTHNQKSEVRQQKVPKTTNQKVNLSYDDFLTMYKPENLKDQTNQVATYRSAIYQQNIDKINDHNQNSSANFAAGINSLTDLLSNELTKSYGGLIIPQEIQNQISSFTSPPNIKIDWRCYESPVLSQGKCLSSYAISALDAVQTSSRIQGRSIVYLSIQQVISCGKNKDIRGCQGGFYQGVYDYVREKGVGQSSVYFYDEKASNDGVLSKCNDLIVSSPSYTKTRVFIKQSKRIKAGDCEQIVNQLRYRVMTVGIASFGMQFYSQGTFQTDSTEIDHAVVLVGYDPQNGYLIKNSWGKTWGMDGYGYVSESTGVCNYAIYPILIDDSASEKLPPKACNL